MSASATPLLGETPLLEEAPKKPQSDVLLFDTFGYIKAAAVLWYWFGYVFITFLGSFSLLAHAAACLVLLALDFCMTWMVVERLVASRRANAPNDCIMAATTAYGLGTKPEGVCVAATPAQKRYFWTAMLAAMGHWLAASCHALFGLSLKYLFVSVLAVVMTGSNIRGYFKREP